MPAPIVLRREVLSPLTPEQLWPVVADTEQLNRAGSLPSVRAEPVPDRGAARFLLHGKHGPFAALWEEPPYEWIEHERLTITRRVHRGMVTSFSFSVRLEPQAGGGTRVDFEIAFVPRWRWAGPLFGRGTRKTLDGFADAVRRAASDAPAPSHPRLEAVVSSLREASIPEALAAAIARSALEEPDAVAARLRPYELARRWGQPRRDVLAAHLQAVTAGVLDLRWEIVCPGCRMGSQVVQALDELEEHGRCHLCDLEFQLDLDRSVEATFRPVRTLRELDVGPYCIGGPARMPHVVAQAVVEPPGTAELRAPSTAGRYRLAARGGAAAALEVTAGAPPRAAIRCAGSVEPAHVRVAPGGVVTVAADRALHVRLERLDWSSLAATAHDLALLPAFRATFSAGVLRRGLALRVERVALLFTDLTGSTDLYARLGDAVAFGFVEDHFRLLTRLVEAHGGAVVKTIGDAVMAAFATDAGALSCALEARAAFGTFRDERGVEGPELKLGVHSGTCFGVTANDRLDYFGHTVNVAARLQGQAGPGEIVTSAESAERSGLRLEGRTFAARLKGVSEPIAALRVEPERARASWPAAV